MDERSVGNKKWVNQRLILLGREGQLVLQLPDERFLRVQKGFRRHSRQALGKRRIARCITHSLEPAGLELETSDLFRSRFFGAVMTAE